jgi:hypothetical protein
MTPASAPISLVRKAKTGVGKTPRDLTLAPPDKRPETKASSSIKPETLVSRATSTSLALENVATAKPILAAKTGAKSTLTNPRTPELPNSLVPKFSHHQRAYCKDDLRP